MDAVGAQDSDDDGAHRAHNVTSVGEGFRHGQDAGSQTAFHQVKEGFHVPVGGTLLLAFCFLSYN